MKFRIKGALPSAGFYSQGITTIDLSLKLLGGPYYKKDSSVTAEHPFIGAFTCGFGSSVFTTNKSTYAAPMFVTSYTFWFFGKKTIPNGIIIKSQITFFKVNHVKDIRFCPEVGWCFGSINITYGYNIPIGKTSLPTITKNKIGIGLLF